MKVKLEEVCDVRDGTHDSPKYIMNGGYPLVTSKNIVNGKLDLSVVNYINKEDFNKINQRSKVDIGDILMPMIGTIGNPYLVDSNKEFAIKNVALIKFHKNIVFNKYIFYFLKSDAFYAYVNETNRGGNQKFLSLSDIRKMQIPLKAIDEQLKIAAILDQVNNLISLRNQQLEQFDLLVKSRFVEMFGDPVNNKYNIRKLKWIDVFNTTTGKLDSNAMVENGKYPFFTCAKEAFRINTYAFDCEALLLAGNNAAGVYDVKYYKGKFNAYQRTYVLQLKDSSWSYVFFKNQLEDKLGYLKERSIGSNTKYLTLKILQEIDFIIPDTMKQNQFADFVQQVDKAKSSIKKSLKQLETLKKKLMQDYFG